MTHRVERAFQEYMASVYPGVTVGGTQLTECRTAFFAGVHWMQAKFPESLDMGDEPTEADMAVMIQVDDEIRDHISSLVPTVGRA